jgi:hypothetical protein
MGERIVRNISYTLEIQWDGSSWTNESQYLMSLSGAFELVKPSESFLNGRPIIGEHQVILWNEGSRFSDYNSGSPLYAHITNGSYERKKVRLSITIEGVTSSVFKGQIKRIDESFVERTVTIVCRDPLEWLKTKVSSTMILNEPAHEVIARYLSDAGLEDGTDFVSVASGTPQNPATIDFFTQVIPYVWLDDEAIWDELAEVVRSLGGRVQMRSDGKVYVEADWRWSMEPYTPVVTFTLSNAGDILPSFIDKEHADEIIVEYSERVMGSTDAELWKLPKAVYVYPGKVEVIEARFQWPAVVVSAPADYSLVDITGKDLSASGASLTMQAYGQRAILTLTNNSTSVCVLAVLKLRGTPLLGLPSQQIKLRDNALAYSLTLEERSNFYIQTRAQAQALANVLQWLNSSRKRLYTISKIQGNPSYEPGKRVAISAGLLNVAGIIVYAGYQGKTGESGSSFTQTLRTIEDEFQKSLFIIGSSSLTGNTRVYWH